MKPAEIFETIRTILTLYIPPLRLRVDTPDHFEVCSRHENMQRIDMEDSYYFASLVKKENLVMFYFYPITSHLNRFPDIPLSIGKMLHENSCFHFTSLDIQMAEDLASIIKCGVNIYQQEKLL